jgi:hypothetical protein
MVSGFALVYRNRLKGTDPLFTLDFVTRICLVHSEEPVIGYQVA